MAFSNLISKATFLRVTLPAFLLTAFKALKGRVHFSIFGLLYTLTNYDELSLLQPSASIEEVDA
jgi:hypothetical protein